MAAGWRPLPLTLLLLLLLLQGLISFGSGATGPQLPRTCAPDSAGAAFAFCNTSLSHDARARQLVDLLDRDEMLALFSIASPGAARYVERLNLKLMVWDTTCVQGVAPVRFPNKPRSFVYPQAIAQGATWDPTLVHRLGRAIAREARQLNRALEQHSGGKLRGGIICDGGPLANLAQDPRWGRISETYGEDPLLVSRVGVAATRGLQNMQCGDRGRCFYETAQVTRHLLGYHGAHPDLPRSGEELVGDDDYLRDVLAAPYRAFQEQGGALGLMCAISTIDGVPSCARRDLLQLVTAQTNTTVVQSDCCDSITAMFRAHHWAESLEQAVAAAIKAGVSVSYSYGAKAINQAVSRAIDLGLIPEAALRQAAENVVRLRMRLGEFEPNEPHFADGDGDPVAASEEKRAALARELIAASAVLLRNRGGTSLPFPALHGAGDGARLRVAMIGPFANCTSSERADYGSDDCYLHGYHGRPTVPRVRTLLDEIASDDRVAFAGFEPGCASPVKGGAVQRDAAQRLVRDTEPDYVLLCLGLGASVETESYDRRELGLPKPQADLLDAVLAARLSHTRVVLLLHAAGPVTLAPAQIRALDAILVVWYGGQEHAAGVRRVLFGDEGAAPGGRLPTTVYREGYLARLNLTIADLDARKSVGRTTRYLKEPPLWPFGFGLRYFPAATKAHVAGCQASERGPAIRCAVLRADLHPQPLLVQLFVNDELCDFQHVRPQSTVVLTARGGRLGAAGSQHHVRVSDGARNLASIKLTVPSSPSSIA